MKFLLLQAVKTVLRKRSTSILTLICFFFGTLLLFIACSYGEAILAELNSFKVKNSEQSIFVTIQTQAEENKRPVTTQDAYDFLQSYDFIDEISLTTNINLEKLSAEAMRFSIIDEKFADTFQYSLVAGRMFFPEEYHNASSVCVIEKDRITSKGMEIGDSIVIDDEAYQIVGVIRTMEFANELLLPSSVEEDFKDAISGFTIVARLSDMQYAGRIDWTLLTPGYVRALTAEEHYQQRARYLLNLFSLVFLVGILVYIYSLINIYNIIVVRVIDNVKSTGTRIALGARPRDIFMQIYFEILMIMLMVTLLIFALDPIINIAVQSTLNHWFGPITLLILILNALITTLFISLRLYKRMMKHSAAELMNGGFV